MLDRVTALINQKEYTKALNLVEKILLEDQKSVLELDEKIKSKLISYRIGLKALIGDEDSIVTDFVRKEKFPSVKEFNFVNDGMVRLVYKNVFNQDADAYVNSIHDKNFFKVSERDTSTDFLKLVGEESIKDQIEQQKNIKRGDFVTLEHPLLSAPFSYHILCYHDQNELDLKALQTGLNRVLNDSSERSLKSLAIIPLGYDKVVKADRGDKDKFADEITNLIAETVFNFFLNGKRSSPPVITFCIVSTITFDTFNRILYHWSKKDEHTYRLSKKLDEKKNYFIRQANTNNPEFRKTLEEIAYLLDEKNTILLLGETGVGKSFLAGLIRRFSSIYNRKFIEDNCALIRPDFIESRLFGTIRSSHSTGRDKPGLIEQADNGTLFLDEIGDAHFDVQRGLLKFLDSGEFRRMDDDQVRISDIRLILGTNKDIEKLVREGKFAHDFYDRINQNVFTIPALRERPEDIEILVQWRLSLLNEDLDEKVSVSPGVIKKLQKYNWPGNVRQLINQIDSWFKITIRNKKLIITDDIIEMKPPRDELYILPDDQNDFVSLQNNLQKYLKEWNSGDGKFLQKFIEPLLAKIYLDDLKYNKTESSKILGLDGSRGDESTLDKRYQEYQKLKKNYS